jgi:acetyl esterase/lipase
MTTGIPAVYHDLLTKGGYSFPYASILENEIQVTYSVPDLVDFTERKFVRSFTASGTTVSASTPVQRDKRYRGRTDTNPSFHVVEGEKDKLFGEFWTNGIELVRFELKDVKDVYMNHNVIGEPCVVPSSHDNRAYPTLIFFIGEPSDKVFPKGTYFSAPTDDVLNEKFKLVPDFGETMLKAKSPTLYMVTDKGFTSAVHLRCADTPIIPLFVKLLSREQSTTRLIVSGMPRTGLNELYLPGLSRCFNRRTFLYMVEVTSTDFITPTVTVTCLTERVFLALCPVVSHDRTSVVFAGHKDVFYSHCTKLELYRLDMDSGAVSVITTAGRSESQTPGIAWEGLYLSAQGESGLMEFLPETSTLVVPSFCGGRSGIFLVDTKDPAAVTSPPKSLFPPISSNSLASVMLMKVQGNQIVFVHQGYTCQRSLWLARMGAEDVEYTELFRTPSVDRSLCAGFLEASMEELETDNCKAWLLRSGVSGVRSPLICYIHGGPFMGAVSSFSVEMAAFLAQGYDVVIPNYRGSFGYGNEFLKSLEGNAGILDVQDCHECVLKAKEILTPSIVIAYGGSHGGFITGWLLGNPNMKDTYAGGVLWNPAVDLVSSSLTSDIPDWAMSVGAHQDMIKNECIFAPSLDFVTKAYNQSAMSVVKNVTAPSLVMLGANDRRVVPAAGLRWAQAVKANGAQVDVHWFPDQGHAIPAPEYYETAIVTISTWIHRLVNRK